jgi:hypothetical protein
VYWNRDKVLEVLEKKYAAFGNIPGNSCVSTGNALGNGNVYTLEEQENAISSNTIVSFCPLYSNIPQYGYYGEYGLPYPVGTQIFTESVSDTVNTGDPLNPLVQYRYDPQDCSIQGKPSGNTCPGLPELVPNSYCANNTERQWFSSRLNG